MVNIEELTMKYFSNDLEVPYNLKKGAPLSLKPIKVKDWDFVDNFRFFNIPKNELGSAEFIQMSYLQFLHEVYFGVYPDEMNTFLSSLSLSFNLRDDGEVLEYVGFHHSKGKVVLVVVQKDKTVENGKEEVISIISGKEFDEIKKIILFQNILDYDDSYISPDVRELVDDYIRLSSKGGKTPSLEERKIYVFSKKNITIQELNEMSYRLFCQLYNMLYSCEEYLVTRIIEASEKFKVDKLSKHPLHEKKKSIYDEVFTESADSFTNRVSQVSG